MFIKLLRLNPTRSFLVGLGLVGFIILSTAFCIFITKVGMSIMFGPAEWGQFGDFVGGTTNPLLAFLTFIGVLWTISLTYDQRKDQEKQSQKDDLCRIIEIIHSDLKNAIEIRNCRIRNEKTYLNRQSFRPCSIQYLTRIQHNDDFNCEEVLKLNGTPIMNTAQIVTNLMVYLEEHEKLADNSYVSLYYSFTYQDLISMLAKTNVLDEKVIEFFRLPTEKTEEKIPIEQNTSDTGAGGSPT